MSTRKGSAGRMGLAVFAMFMLVALPLTAAATRSSANYRMQYDTIGSGITPMSSASYTQPQAECGQVVIWNHYVNSHYDFQPVGTFLFGSPSSVANYGWMSY